MREIKVILDNYKSDNLPVGENKYATLYSDLNPYFTPYKLLDEENMSYIVADKLVNTNINTIVNNLENGQYFIQKYNTALTKLNMIDSTGDKMVTVRTNITPNDDMQIESFEEMIVNNIRY
jgi:hypothetical protein